MSARVSDVPRMNVLVAKWLSSVCRAFSDTGSSKEYRMDIHCDTCIVSRHIEVYAQVVNSPLVSISTALTITVSEPMKQALRTIAAVSASAPSRASA